MNKKYIHHRSGFTLVELIIVVAIIGVLAAIVLTFLTKAKNQGEDASVKAGLNQVRTQADLFITAYNVYTNVCSTASDSLSPRGINAMVYGAGKVNGYTNPVNVNGAGTSTVRCNEASNGWAAEIPLKNQTGYYCVDYTKKGIVTATSIGDTNAFCS